jgi:hypothetical protein
VFTPAPQAISANPWYATWKRHFSNALTVTGHECRG